MRINLYLNNSDLNFFESKLFNASLLSYLASSQLQVGVYKSQDDSRLYDGDGQITHGSNYSVLADN